jgi:nicotinate-nucleotide adenylyltransferase
MRRPDNLAGVLGIFGGTFDPVHIGHLRTAFELGVRLDIDRIHFIPAAVPPHRPQPVASAELRLRMLEAALADETDAVVDRRELDRAGPSWSIDTAESLRAEFPGHALCLLLGMDAFLGLPEWRDRERLLTLVNIVVARRPGASLPESGRLGRLLAERRIEAGSDTEWATAGQLIVQDVTQLEVSATDLRASVRAGVAPKYLVPDAVRNIIATSGCYAGGDESP